MNQITSSIIFICFCSLLVQSCTQNVAIERGQFELPKDVDIAECEVGKYGGALVLSESTEPKTFNPLVEADLVSAVMQGKFLSSLISYHPIKETYIPDLAKSWKISEDKLTYTFQLREGVRWSDGDPFDADDVIFSLDCIFEPEIDPKTNKPVVDSESGKVKYKYLTRKSSDLNIGGEPIDYEKIDDYTVRFSTKIPYAPFLYTIATLEILPKHKLFKPFQDGRLQEVWSSKTAIDSPEELVGTGPFLVHKYTVAERIVFKPNPHYWRSDSAGKRLPYIDYLIYKFVGDGTVEVILFATGNTHAAGIPATDLAWVKKMESLRDLTIHDRGPSSSILFMWWNQNDGFKDDGNPYIPKHKLKWFSSKLFRQAMAYGFNRQGIIDGVYFKRAAHLDSCIAPAQGKWHNSNVKKYRYNVEKAKALLKEDGFELNEEGQLVDNGGNKVELEITVFDGSQKVATMATTLVENMKALGIALKVEYTSFGTLLKKIDQTFDYDMALVGWGSAGAAYDPNGSKALYHSSGMHHMWHPKQSQPATEWEARIDAIMDQQEGLLDEEKRVGMIHEMQSIMAEELPLLYLISPNTYVGVSNEWKNVNIPPAGSILWNTDEIWVGDDQ